MAVSQEMIFEQNINYDYKENQISNQHFRIFTDYNGRTIVRQT